MLVLYGLSNYNDAAGQKILAEARKFIEDLFKKNPLSKWMWKRAKEKVSKISAMIIHMCLQSIMFEQMNNYIKIQVFFY